MRAVRPGTPASQRRLRGRCVPRLTPTATARSASDGTPPTTTAKAATAADASVPAAAGTTDAAAATAADADLPTTPRMEAATGTTDVGAATATARARNARTGVGALSVATAPPAPTVAAAVTPRRERRGPRGKARDDAAQVAEAAAVGTAPDKGGVAAREPEA